MANTCENHQWTLQTKEGAFGEIVKSVKVPENKLQQVISALSILPQGAVVFCERCGSTPNGKEQNSGQSGFNAQEIINKLAS